MLKVKQDSRHRTHQTTQTALTVRHPQVPLIRVTGAFILEGIEALATNFFLWSDIY